MSGITITNDTLTPKLKALPATTDAAVWAVASLYAPRVQAELQANAPWADQTGNARQGLKGRPRRRGKSQYAIVGFHTMPYGVWLETRWSGRYAVVMPTLMRMAPEILAAAGQAVIRLGKGI